MLLGLPRPLKQVGRSLIALLCVFWCAATIAAAQDNQRSDGAEREKVRIILDWFVNPDHGPLVVAQQSGLFRKAGLEVELIEPANPNDPVRILAAGGAEVAISYQPSLAVFVATGLPVKRFATLVATPLNALVVLDSSPIRSVAQLRGKRVGFSVAGFEDAILGTMLDEVGLSLADVELINVNFALTPALMTTRVDAVIGAFRNFELNQLEIEGSRGRAIYPEENGVPAYDELVYVARDDSLRASWLPRLLNALEEATTRIINHPEETWQSFIGYKRDLDNELNRRAWRDTIPRFALRPRAMDTYRYDRVGQFLHRRGLIERPLKASDYAVEIK